MYSIFLTLWTFSLNFGFNNLSIIPGLREVIYDSSDQVINITVLHRLNIYLIKLNNLYGRNKIFGTFIILEIFRDKICCLA